VQGHATAAFEFATGPSQAQAGLSQWLVNCPTGPGGPFGAAKTLCPRPMLPDSEDARKRKGVLIRVADFEQSGSS